MKKRLLSLVLCLVMVFSLFPAFTAPVRAEGEVQFDYAPATDASGGQWTIEDITAYQANGNTHDLYALESDNHTLYFFDGSNYYPVDFVSDPEYFYQETYVHDHGLQNFDGVKIYSNFTKDSPNSAASWWGPYEKYGRISAKDNDASVNYYVFYNGDMHAVYYNCKANGLRYDTTLFIYKNDRISDAAYGDDNGDGPSKWTALKNNQDVLLLWESYAAPTTDYSGAEWKYTWQTAGATVGTSGNYYGDEGSVCPQLYLKGADDGTKRAIIYKNEDGVQLGYVARNWKMETTNSASPGDPVYGGTLYYKRDLDKVPVIDPDPTETTTPGGEGGTIVNPEGESEDGFKLQKSLGAHGDGTYDLTMKSYSIAKTERISQVEKVPTDFVVIVDQSGSMEYSDMLTGNPQPAPRVYLEDIAQYGTEEENKTPYFYKDGENYYRVYATRDHLMEYHPADTKWTEDIIEDAGYDLSWFQGKDEATFTQKNQYYYKTRDGAYRPVHVTATGKIGTYYIEFYYNDADGNQVDFVRPSNPIYNNVFGGGQYGPRSFGYPAVNAAVQTAYPRTTAYTYSKLGGLTTGMYINYPMYTRHVGYSKLCYRDVDGVEHVLGPVTGNTVAQYCDHDGNAVISAGSDVRMQYDGLYVGGATQTRLAALKTALNAFVKKVAAETDTRNDPNNPTPVENRIAIVGFASEKDDTNYSNTELLTTGLNGTDGVQMRAADGEDYAAALIPAAGSGVDGVNPDLYSAINAITARGGTQAELGFQMAASIFDNRGENTTYTMITDNNREVQRNKVVVFFTDGQPGNNILSNQYEEANEVISDAKIVKDMGAKVFSIGVFGESDGNPLTYVDGQTTNKEETRDWEYEGGWMDTLQYRSMFSTTYYFLRRQWRPSGAAAVDDYTKTPNDTIFDYMSVTSSNYPDAQKFITDEWLDGNHVGGYTSATDGIRHKDTAEKTNKFYRMASTQATLVEAFEQSVSYASTQQQHSGVVRMDDTAIFHDEININDFDISNATYSVTWQPIHVVPSGNNYVVEEFDGSAEYPMATPVVNQPVPANGVIEYDGFDYSSYFVTSAKKEGYKLVVTVNGLIPTTYGDYIKSNADDTSKPYYACGIYEYGKDEPEYSVKSPTLFLDIQEPTTGAMDMHKTISGQNPEDGSYTIYLDAFAKGKGNTTLDADGYLLDTIDLNNLALRSDLAKPEVKVFVEKGTADRNQNITWSGEKTNITDMVDVLYDEATGEVRVVGFDFTANYIGFPKPANVEEGTLANQGKKLYVEIAGLVPLHAGMGQTSNTVAGVYDENGNPIVTVPSPTFDVATDAANNKTYIIDFSAPMKVATDANSVAQKEVNNGVFSQVGTDIIYQFNGSATGGNLAMDGVDTAFAHAKLVGTTMQNADWCTITAVPANNIYFDDDFLTYTDDEGEVHFKDAIAPGTGSGFNVAIEGEDKAEDIAKGRTMVFTFTGDRIDIFCNTTGDSNFFSANLYGSDGVTAAQDVDGKSFYLITGASTDDLANIPVLSVRMKSFGTYVLKLNVGVQTNFSLDGVRVYNSMGKNADAASAYIAAKENNATFTQVRQILLNTDKVPFTLPDGMDSVIGALYRDKDSDQPYAKSGPKNEVYLEGGTGDQAKHEEISFIIDGYDADTQKIMIGLSAPKSKTVSAESPADVLVTYGDGSTTTLHVQSQTHMYYQIVPTTGGKVVIKNNSSTLISIDNVKITDNQPTRNVLGAPKFMVNRALVAYADEFDTLPVVESNIVPEDPGTDPGTEPGDDPGTEPTHQPSFSELIQQLLSNFVKNLFGSISRLFGN